MGIIVGILMKNHASVNSDGDIQNDGVEELVETTKSDDISDERSDDGMEEEILKEKNVVQYEGDNPNKAEDLSGVVTYAGVNNDKLVIRVNIDQYLSNGSCELNLMRNGDIVYSNKANIVSSASTATCEGFDVPVNAVGSGNTEISIKLNADERSGLIRGEVNI